MTETLAMRGGRPAAPKGLVRRPWPPIPEAVFERVLEVLDSHELTGNFAPMVTELQERWGEIHDSMCLATNSGTAAIHCALYALDIRPGDEVIVPAISFSGTVQPILALDAKPVFVDVDPVTFNMDASKLEEVVTDATKVIMPVHLHGQMCDMDPIMEFAEGYVIHVIEDACQAHLARYHSKLAGTLGTFGCFSLNAAQALPGGEGGLLISKDPNLMIDADLFRNYGEHVVSGQRGYVSTGLGLNYPLHELPAAVALGHLDSLADNIQRGICNAGILDEALVEIPGFTAPLVAPNRVHTYHKYRVLFDAEKLGINASSTHIRKTIVDALRAEGVGCCTWQIEPVPAWPLFGESREKYPNASHILDNSFIVGTEGQSLAAQSVELMQAWGRGLQKVARSLKALY